MANWDEFKDQSRSYSIADIKEQLPISYVLAVADVLVNIGTDGKLHAICPFHEDDTPSFDVGKDNKGFDRWWCTPCKATQNNFGEGDVLDLIQMLPMFNVSTAGEAKQKAIQLIQQMNEEGWVGPQLIEQRPFDLNSALDVCNSIADLEYLDDFIERKGYPFTSDYLVREWAITTFNTWIVCPHFENGQLVGYKHRNGAEEGFISAAGSKLKSHFYGEERLTSDMRKPVFLTESETDVWVGHYYLGEQFTVLGLPAGAGVDPRELAERLAGRLVVVAFDGDEAGRSANKRWFDALTARGCAVKLLPLADGKDIGSMRDVNVLVESARTVRDAPRDIYIDTAFDGYVRFGKKDDVNELTNWRFDPRRELRGEDGTAYEGIVTPSGEKSVITSMDLKSRAAAVQWAIEHESTFYGTDKDAQQILGILQNRGPFLATGRMTTVAGLHDKQFVYPGGYIGDDYWVYIPPNVNVDLANDISINNLDWKIQQLLVMRKLHKRSVMDPILAWLAVAPLRSMFREFPILAVLAGNAGLGKTTLVETTVRAFTGTLLSETLMDTTKFAMGGLAAALNFAPVWFDEYKIEAGERNLNDVRQLIREAWNGKGGRKGGDAGNWQKISKYPRNAPVIISGEESFTEVSITERAVTVVLPVGGRNPVALSQVQSWGDTGYSYNYLKFLHEGLKNDSLPEIRNFNAGPTNLQPRQQTTLGVLYLGWELLRLFLRANGIDPEKAGWTIPEFESVIQEMQESSHTNPYREALLWATAKPDSYTFSKIDQEQDRLIIEVESLMNYVSRNSSMKFPGGKQATERSLKALYGATEEIVQLDNRQQRCLVMSMKRIVENEITQGDDYEDE